jgi:hypothetical protein
MGITAKGAKVKDQKHMNSSKSDEVGAFTRKPWAESTTKEKVAGVAVTAAAYGVAGATMYHAFKK